MKKWLVLLCITAIAAPAAMATSALGETFGTEVLYPADVYHHGGFIDGPVPDYKDVYILLCVGTSTLNVDISDSWGDDTMFLLAVKYGAGIVEYGQAPEFSVSDEVTGWGLYFFIVGYTEASFPAGYSLHAEFVEVCECTLPIYEPEKWNDGGSVQYNNNCYNYANDEITMTFAQPGRAHGCSHYLTCETVTAAAECDGLISIPSGQVQCPDTMHKVYLVIWPGRDYHWYRIDEPDGRWSHKPGSTPATDRDGSGQFIYYPETADTGSYTDHCGYLCACGECADIS